MFDVILEGATGQDKVRLLRWLRQRQPRLELFNLGRLWASLPAPIGTLLPLSRAEALAEHLRGFGASVRIAPTPAPHIAQARAWLDGDEGPRAAFGEASEPEVAFRLLCEGRMFDRFEVLVAKWPGRLTGRARHGYSYDPWTAPFSIDSRAWGAVEVAADACDFWEPLLPDEHCGADGVVYIAHGWRPGQLQRWWRWCPGSEPFGALCDELLSLCLPAIDVPKAAFCSKDDLGELLLSPAATLMSRQRGGRTVTTSKHRTFFS
jgi:hypothetical protein